MTLSLSQHGLLLLHHHHPLPEPDVSVTLLAVLWQGRVRSLDERPDFEHRMDSSVTVIALAFTPQQTGRWYLAVQHGTGKKEPVMNRGEVLGSFGLIVGVLIEHQVSVGVMSCLCRVVGVGEPTVTVVTTEGLLLVGGRTGTIRPLTLPEPW